MLTNTGTDTVNVGSTNARITIGGGKDVVKTTGKGASVSVTGNGGLNYTGVGTDTIRLASGTDTIVDKGGATVFGGSGKFSFTGGTIGDGFGLRGQRECDAQRRRRQEHLRRQLEQDQLDLHDRRGWQPGHLHRRLGQGLR